MLLILSLLWPLLILLLARLILDGSAAALLIPRNLILKIDSRTVRFSTWAALSISGYLLRPFLAGKLGIFLTLVLPALCFVLTFSPFLIGDSGKKTTEVSTNSISGGIATLIFWQSSVTSVNWNSGAVIFVAIIPWTAGLLIMTTVLLQRMPNWKKRSIGMASLIIFCFLIANHYMIWKNDTLASLEVVDKLELAKAVAQQVKANKPVTGFDLSQIDRLKRRYSLGKRGNLQNKYGGEVVVTQTTTTVSIQYTNVPSGEPCFNMYFVNNPSMYGFKETFVDDSLTRFFTSSPKAYNDERDRLCFAKSSPKAIEFRGKKADLMKIEDEFLK